MAVQLRFVLTASIWLTSSLMSIIFNVMARVVALSAASSRLSVISVVVYVMMVVMNCLRERVQWCHSREWLGRRWMLYHWREGWIGLCE